MFDGINPGHGGQSTSLIQDPNNPKKAILPDEKQWITRIKREQKRAEEDIQNFENVRMVYNGKFGNNTPAGMLLSSAGITFNFLKSYIDTLLPNIFFQTPKWNVITSNGHPYFSRADQEILNHSASEMNFLDEIQAVAFDAVLCGSGIVVYDFDHVRGLSRFRRVPPDSVVFGDKSKWRLDDQPWIAIRNRVSLVDARSMFKDNNLRANRTNSGEKHEVTVEFGRPALLDVDNDIFEYWTVYERTETERTIRCVADGQEEGHGFLSFNVFDPTAPNSKRMAKRGDWPFVIDKEDWPIDILRFNTVNDSVYGQNENAQYVPYVLALDSLISGLMVRTQKAFANKLLIDSKVDPDAISKLTSSKIMEVIQMDLEGRSARDVAAVLEFAGIDQNIYQFVTTLKQIFDEIVGMNELLRGGFTGGRKSAREVDIMEKQSAIKSFRKQKAIDDFLVRVGRKLRIINAQSITPEKAMSIVSEKIQRDGNLFEAGQDGLSAWGKRSLDISGILEESRVEIEINSTRRRSTDEELNRIMNTYGMLSQVVDQTTGMPFMKADHHISWMHQILTAAEMPNPEQLLPTIEEVRIQQEMLAQQMQQMQAQQAEQDQAMQSQAQQMQAAQMEQDMADREIDRQTKLAKMDNEDIKLAKEVASGG